MPRQGWQWRLGAAVLLARFARPAGSAPAQVCCAAGHVWGLVKSLTAKRYYDCQVPQGRLSCIVQGTNRCIIGRVLTCFLTCIRLLRFLQAAGMLCCAGHGHGPHLLDMYMTPAIA